MQDIQHRIWPRRNRAIGRSLRTVAMGFAVGASPLLACEGHCPSPYKEVGNVCRIERDASVEAGAGDASGPTGTMRGASMRDDGASDRDEPMSKADTGGKGGAGAAGSLPKDTNVGGGPSADGARSGSAATQQASI